MSRSRMVDFWVRGEKGDIVDEKFYDLKIFWKNLSQITKKYDISYDPEYIVPQEKHYDMLDRIFAAAKEFLLATGVYHTNTRRVIRFEPWEIDECLAKIPDYVVLGTGDDAVHIHHNNLCSKTRPIVKGRCLGAHTPELIEKVFESFAKEPMVDIFHLQAIIPEIYGVNPAPRTPYEMMAEFTRTSLAKNALRKVGRIGAYDGSSAPVTPQALMMGFEPGWGKVASDGGHCYIMPGMKIDYDNQCRALFYHERNIKFWSSAMGYIGGMDGGPNTSAVALVAQALAEQLLYKPTCQQLVGGIADYNTTTSPEALWAGFYSCAAFRRNTKCAYIRANPSGYAGAMMGREHFWEIGAAAICSQALGFVASGGTGALSGGKDCAAGISAGFAGMVCHAAIGISKEKANELCKKFVAQFIDKFNNKTLHTCGRNFPDSYDLVRVVPNDWLRKELDYVKEEMNKMGFAIN